MRAVRENDTAEAVDDAEEARRQDLFRGQVVEEPCAGHAQENDVVEEEEERPRYFVVQRAWRRWHDGVRHHRQLLAFNPPCAKDSESLVRDSLRAGPVFSRRKIFGIGLVL